MRHPVFDFASAPFEAVPCNLCGAENFFVLARRGANGLLVRTCLCKQCGLIYISPRMTKEGYGAYYKYSYRKDRQAVKGDASSVLTEEHFDATRRFGRALGGRVRALIRSGVVLDVGSSTGGVLAGFRDVVPGLRLVGIEPSVVESEFANRRGIRTYTTLFENFSEPLGDLVTIICVQSLNHLLDPRGFFRWCFEHLPAGGHLILSVKNFRQQVRRAGRLESGVQIDHPYMFVPETLRALVELVGFTVVYEDVDEEKSAAELKRQHEEGLTRQHIYLVGEKPATPRGVRVVSSPYWRLRVQLSRPAVRLYNLFNPSRALFLRFSRIFA